MFVIFFKDCHLRKLSYYLFLLTIWQRWWWHILDSHISPRDPVVWSGHFPIKIQTCSHYNPSEWMNEWMNEWTDTSLRYSTATEECVSNDFFRHLLDDSPASYLTKLPSPSLNTVELIVIHNCPCEHSSQLQLSIRFTPSRCLDVRQDWYPMYYPEGMKARQSPGPPN